MTWPLAFSPQTLEHLLFTCGGRAEGCRDEQRSSPCSWSQQSQVLGQRCPYSVGCTDTGDRPLLGGRGCRKHSRGSGEVLEEEWALARLTVDWKEGCCQWRLACTPRTGLEGCIWEAVSGLESDYRRPGFSDQGFGLYAQDWRV